MRRLTMRMVLAAAAAGGALVMVAGTGLGPANATAIPRAPIATTSQAGYVATHATFRYVTTTIQVPASSQNTSYAEIVLGSTTGHPATLGVKSGGGTGSVAWNVVGPLGAMGGGTMQKIVPKPGDVLTLSIYYNAKAGRDNFTATDVTQKVSQTLVLPPSPHQVYTAAEVACLLTGKVTAPAQTTRLWEFTGTGVTTAAGTHGTMNGPWLTRKIIDVAPDGHIVMKPSGLWNNGANFGAWLLRATK